MCYVHAVGVLADTYLSGSNKTRMSPNSTYLTGHPELKRTKAKRPYYLCNNCVSELKRKTQRLIYTSKTQNALETETVKLWSQNAKTETRKTKTKTMKTRRRRA